MIHKNEFLTAIRIHDFRIAALEYLLSKIASSKWTELQIFSEDVIC